MKKKMALFGLCVSLLLVFGSRAFAFNEPPSNFGATTFLDGGGAPPGVYLVEYFLSIQGDKAIDGNGHVIPGGARVNALTQLNQLWWLTPVKFLGAYVGLNLLQPIAAPTVTGSLGPFPLTNNTAGFGDFVAGGALQWNDNHLFGRPFLHRFEVDVTAPSGKYSKNYSANPGSNVLTVEPFYAFTWFFAGNWETSWRFTYMFNGTNNATQVRPGQLLHLNYAFSRAVSAKWRVGAAGYILQQMTNDRINGVEFVGSKERAFSAGPGLVYLSDGFTMMLSYPIEFKVQNRFRGSRMTLEMVHRF